MPLLAAAPGAVGLLSSTISAKSAVTSLMSENATPASGRAGAPSMAACARARESQHHISIHVFSSIFAAVLGKPGERAPGRRDQGDARGQHLLGVRGVDREADESVNGHGALPILFWLESVTRVHH